MAEFEYPISGCGHGAYQVEILYQYGSSSSAWVPLNDFVISGTSDGDLSGDGNINLTEVIMLNLAIGSCEGDPAYIPCGDYSPDGCINPIAA